MLKTNDGIIDIDSSPNSRKRKRVTFSSSGTYSLCLTVIQLTHLTLKMAEKHELEPCVQKPGEYRKSVPPVHGRHSPSICSEWITRKATIKNSHLKYININKQIQEWKSAIHDYSIFLIIIGLQAMRAAAKQITIEDLRSHGSRDLVQKLRNDP